jgi:hypothetical protein
MVKRTESLQDQIDAGVRAALARLGITIPVAASDDPTEQPGYIAHGSPEHAQFLGLVVVDDDDDPTGFVTYESRETGRTFRLEDELGAVAHYPGVDPDKAALMLLRGKVNVLEGGPPEAPANTPSMWTPVDQYTVLVGGSRQ